MSATTVLTCENEASRRGALTPPTALTHPSDCSGRRAGVSLPSEEQWRPVPGFEGLYAVSDQGRLWSLPRPYAKSRILDGYVQPEHSPYVAVRLSRNGRTYSSYMHALVMRAFVGPRPEGLEVRHLNGNPEDNRLSNLRYGTRSENTRDQVRHGVHAEAARTHCPKGHPYDEANTRVRPRGGRACIRCQDDRNQARGGGVHNAVKTHCPQGHPYDEVNTYVDRRGHRDCKTCRRARKRAGAVTRYPAPRPKEPAR